MNNIQAGTLAVVAGVIISVAMAIASAPRTDWETQAAKIPVLVQVHGQLFLAGHYPEK